MTAAVFFDVDFTLIHPGPTLPGIGLPGVLRPARHRRRSRPVRRARWRPPRRTLDASGGVYDPAIFIRYTRRIIEGMGGSGEALIDAAARDIYDEWSACQHFTLYEEVPDVLRAIHAPAA